MLAWRDLADVEAGGSETLMSKIAALWAEAGLEVSLRTSHAHGHPSFERRDGFAVIRRSGRYRVFPSAIVDEILQDHRPGDSLVEVWNGVPFFSPVWYRGPKIVALHHVHRNMWQQVLTPRLAVIGRHLEGTLAPPFYRRSQILTISDSSRDEIVSLLGLPAHNITVAPPGIEPRFTVGGAKTEHPSILAVGRLMPPKRFDELIRVVAEVQRVHPTLELVIAGEGNERAKLEQLGDDLDAGSWVRLPGRVSDDDLIALYQRSWVVSSASSAEGWGMTLTEAAACGTPAVASRIAGHRDSVDDNRSGLLADDSRQMVAHLCAVLGDAELRVRLTEGARKHAADFTWEACALASFAPLAREAQRTGGTGGGALLP